MKRNHSFKTIFFSIIISAGVLMTTNCKKKNMDESNPTQTSTGSVTGNSNTGGMITSATSGTATTAGTSATSSTGATMDTTTGSSTSGTSSTNSIR